MRLQSVLLIVLAVICINIFPEHAWSIAAFFTMYILALLHAHDKKQKP